MVVVLAAVVVAEILEAGPFVKLDPVGLQDGLKKKHQYKETDDLKEFTVH